MQPKPLSPSGNAGAGTVRPAVGGDGVLVFLSVGLLGLALAIASRL